MKHYHTSHEHPRFQSQLRHYHRTGTQEQRSWEQWVEGGRGKPPGTKTWSTVLGIAAAVLVLGSAVAAMILGAR